MAVELPREVSIGKIATKPVPVALKEKAKETVVHYIQMARAQYRKPFPMPSISFDLRGMTAGKAYYRKNHVQLNAILYLENTQSFIEDTIPHEVAHLIAGQVFGMGIQAHGQEWKSVMRAFGVAPERTHSYDVSNSRTTATFDYVCRCKEHKLSSRRHANIQRGTSYRCKACGTTLTPKGPAVASVGTINRPLPTPVVTPRTPPRTPATPVAHPRRPTERMLAYAQSLAKTAGVRLPPLVFESFEACQAFIDKLKVAAPAPTVVPPTDKQLDYARSIAVKKRLTIPPEVLASRQKLSTWIDTNR